MTNKTERFPYRTTASYATVPNNGVPREAMEAQACERGRASMNGIRRAVLFATFVLLSFGSETAFSHSGGTNAAGCHTNRKTGDYHCHNPKPRVPGRVTYCHVVSGEDRCGYALSTCRNLVRKFGGTCRREGYQPQLFSPPPPPQRPREQERRDEDLRLQREELQRLRQETHHRPVEIRGSRPRVVDADTLEVAGQRVRLQGIDAPESAQSCRQPTGKSYLCGDRATQALRERIGTGTVTCKIAGRDRYNRALGICYAADGTDLNGWLVRQGYALAYRRYSTKYVPEENEAKATQAGIWADEFVPPWAWRRGQRLD